MNTLEQNNKEIKFAKRVLESISLVDKPVLTYEEEKDVVRKALRMYIDKLEWDLRTGNRGNW